MNRNNKYIGLFFFLLGFVLYIEVPKQVPVQTVGTVGPGVFPKTMAIVMMAASLVLIIGSLLKEKKETSTIKNEKNTGSLKKEIPVAIAFGILILYAVLLPKIGFIVSTLLCGFSLMILLKNKKWWLYVVFFALVMAIYIIFKQLLNIQLP